MYIPDPYRVKNEEEIKRFIQNNGFGTLILQNTKQVPDIEDGVDEKGRWRAKVLDQTRQTIARQLPFILDLDSDHYHDGQSLKTLTAHMGKHYPLYNCFCSKGESIPGGEHEGDEALVIFQGPDSYVSPTWYDNIEGATWNYMSVHVYGRIERLGEKELESLIETLLYKYEKQYHTNPNLTLQMMRERYDYLKHHIGAIRIHIQRVSTDVQSAFKLSQDQTDWSQENTIKHLRASGYPKAIEVADEMEKRRK